MRRIEEEGWSLMAAAEAAGISERSAPKWLGRWRRDGEAGLLDRSSAPKRKTQVETRKERARHGNGTSAERTPALPGWLDHYNFRRRHGSLGQQPPAARLCELEQHVG